MRTTVIRNTTWVVAWDTRDQRHVYLRDVDLANQHPSGRLMGIIYPSQIDTCSAELLREPYDYASERNLPW